MRPSAATVPAAKPALLRLSSLISSLFSFSAGVMQTTRLSRHRGAPRQLDYATTLRAKQKALDSGDVCSRKPSQIAGVGQEPLPQRASSQSGLSYSQQVRADRLLLIRT